MTSLSLSLNMSMLAGRSVFKAGNIHRLGNIHPFSHLDLESCLIKDLLLLSLLLVLVMLSCCCCWFPDPECSNMMLFDIQAMLRKSSSNFFHMSLDSVNIASLTLSKSSQLFLKKGSSKKKSLMVTGTLDPDIFKKIFV